jgi:hypothetical protein
VALGAAARVLDVQSVVDQRIGVAVIMTIDSSGSMSGNAIIEAKGAAGTFIRSLQTADQAAIVSFSDRVSVDSGLTVDRVTSLAALDRLQAVGNTALYSAVGQSLEVARSAQLSRRAIILLSDGQDFGGVSSLTRDESLRLAAESGIPIYVIGLGPSIDRGYLEELASHSGGEFFAAPTPSSIPAIYQRLAELLRSQYVVIIESTAPGDVRERSVLLRINAGGGQLEVRATYSTRRSIPVATVAVPPTLVTADESDGSNAVLIALGAVLFVAIVAGSGRYALTIFRERRLAAELAVLSTRAATELEAPAPAGSGPPVPAGLGLVVASGPLAGERFPVGDDPLTIGSRTDAQIKLEGVADVCGRVWNRDGRLMFHDLTAAGQAEQPESGSWLTLAQGDTIEIGPYTLRVEAN